MAIKLDITDDRGVVTNYHTIKSFAYEDGKLSVKLNSYVDESMRDKEKDTKKQNIDAEKYDEKIQKVQKQLDKHVGVDSDVARKKAVELTKKLNDMTLGDDRPKYSKERDLYCATNDIELEYFEPITLEAIYNKLNEQEIFSGSQVS